MAPQRIGLFSTIATGEPPIGPLPAPSHRFAAPASATSSGLTIDSENRVTWRRRIEIALPSAGPNRELVVELLLL